MLVIGLISGTSADAIDAVLCEIHGAAPALSLELRATRTHPFPPDMQGRILDAGTRKGSTDELAALHFELGELFAEAVLALVGEAGLQPADVDLIGSHGQNFWHNVNVRGEVTATLQLTEAALIAERSGITTVSNFRPRDIAAGGQGAPLAATLDWLLLRHPEHWRAVQNIGGIANVTFLPPLNDGESEPLAFDTGPGNSLLDCAVNILSDGRRHYDRHGLLARAGEVEEAWLKMRLAHPYFNRVPPKSTGRETFGMSMTTSLVTSAQRRGMSAPDILASLTALTARSIVRAYERYAPQPVQEVIIGGGGRHNPAIVSMLREAVAPAQLLTHEDLGYPSDHKEAMVFALLAHETWHNRPGSLPALSGASHPCVLGQITPGANYESLARATWGAATRSNGGEDA
ncbi:MAG: anhydro-N-acetylmuramic acid kinase [Anaerolineaceae bacterium]|nr:anhydro-N-acetylmuramic acid kinase [Anaerolineaceae bacterium]MCY3908165.1 anhydro-N-acetylmuramic acid kinase [Anaerolineaceae bacterium]